MSSLTNQVTAFHNKFGHPVNTVPHVPNSDVTRFRVKLIEEEFIEFLVAVYGEDPNLMKAVDLLRSETKICKPVCADLAEVADALADLLYVTEGTNLIFGFPSEEIMAEVQRSNMAKEANGQGKPTKPPGWTEPNIQAILSKAMEVKL